MIDGIGSRLLSKNTGGCLIMIEKSRNQSYPYFASSVRDCDLLARRH